MQRLSTPAMRPVRSGAAGGFATPQLSALRTTRLRPGLRAMTHGRVDSGQRTAPDAGNRRIQHGVRQGVWIGPLGKPVADVAKDTDRDYFMSAEEGRSYGLVDKVVGGK